MELRLLGVQLSSGLMFRDVLLMGLGASGTDQSSGGGAVRRRVAVPVVPMVSVVLVPVVSVVLVCGRFKFVHVVLFT